MAKKLNGKKLVKHVEIMSICIVAVFLTIYLITIVSTSPAYQTEMANKQARVNFAEDMAQVSVPAEEHFERLYAVVEQVEYAETVDEIAQVLQTYQTDDSIGALRYLSRGTAYAYGKSGIEQYNALDEMVLSMAKSDKAGCTPVYFDEVLRKNCVAFYVPVRGSTQIDCLISVVSVGNVVSVGESLHENTTAIAIVGANGTVWSSITAEGFEHTVKTDIFDFFNELTENKDASDVVRTLMHNDKLDVVEITHTSGNYTVAVEPIESLNEQFYLITLSKSEDLLPLQYDYVGHMTITLIVAIAVLIGGAIFAFTFYRRVESAVETVNLTDPVLECPNVEGFKKQVSELMGQKNVGYAVVVCSLKRFRFIEDQYGAKASIDLLKYIKEVLTSVCGENELFGYAGDGKFLLFGAFRNETLFRNRLAVLEGVINKYDLLKDNQVKMQVAAGLYVISADRRRSVADMIDCAAIVCDDAKNSSTTSYMIYTDTVREKINQNEHMEARMEAALGSNEFRLFLQPKYNVERDEVDSAEALVRWFDYQKGDYRYPAEFISLFESNGFIVEMDHFIYLEVLKYLSEAKSRGDKIVPISVNVSRVTAASADFVNFYVGNKNRYMIDDGLITLEFTESYATEDYKKLAEITNALHEGGIRCSIDDFGVGYSSFRILKDLEMDELKLDRLFLDKGVDLARDDKIIKTITELAQECGMTVIMEGVETKEMYDRVVQMGIGVIQGYYYAKAISLEEFKIFIKSNTSIRYKAIVK